MPVREALPVDLAAVTEMVLEHAAGEGAAELCHFNAKEAGAAMFATAPTLHALVAHREGDTTPAGVALWYPTFSSWAGRPGIWLEDLFVRSEHRRLGLAREMLSALRSATDGRVEWDVKDANEAARLFYESLGAVAVGGWARYRWTL